jgi:tetratricopeptide (TPR) repeat protein
MQGRHEDAVLMFQRAIEFDPDYAVPHRELGQIHALREQYDHAWRHAREAARLGDRSLLQQLERYRKVTPNESEPR